MFGTVCLDRRAARNAHGGASGNAVRSGCLQLLRLREPVRHATADRPVRSAGLSQA